MLHSGYSVLQFHLDEKTFLESKEGPLETRLDEAFHGPDKTLFLSVLGHDLGFRSQEDLLDLRHRVVPVKSEWRRNVIHRSCGDGGKEQRDQGGPKESHASHSVHDSAQKIGRHFRGAAIKTSANCAATLLVRRGSVNFARRVSRQRDGQRFP